VTVSDVIREDEQEGAVARVWTLDKSARAAFDLGDYGGSLVGYGEVVERCGASADGELRVCHGCSDADGVVS
jgi:hypothetical protein